MSRATYGVMADFASEQSYLAALKSVSQEGYRRIDTFTPYGVVGDCLLYTSAKASGSTTSRATC